MYVFTSVSRLEPWQWQTPRDFPSVCTMYILFFEQFPPPPYELPHIDFYLCTLNLYIKQFYQFRQGLKTAGVNYSFRF